MYKIFYCQNIYIAQGPVSISNKKSYHKILWSLEAVRLVVWTIVSLWNLTGTSAAVFGSSAAEVPIKFQSDQTNLNTNLVASSLHEILWQDILLDFRSSHDNALRWMPHDLTDIKSTSVQVMAWCHQATSPYLSQCWLSSLSPCGVARQQWVKDRASR